MSRLRARRPLIALAAVLALGAAALGARLAAVRAAESALSARGGRWDGRVDAWDRAEWRGLEGEGWRAERVVLRLVPSPLLEVEGLRVDLAAPGGGGGAGAKDGAAHLVLPVVVEDAAVAWGDRPLLSGLSGRADGGGLRLEGEGVRIGRDGEGRWRAHVERDLDAGPLSGRVVLDVEPEDGGGLRFEAVAPEAVLSHPLLARRPLPPLPVELAGRWRPDGALAVEGRLGDVPLRASGTVRPDDGALDLVVEVPPTELAEVVALFGRLVPEAATARVRGRVGLRLRLAALGEARTERATGEIARGLPEAPALRWSAEPSAEGLAVEGAVPDLDALRRGPFTWRAADGEGGWVARSTGEGTPGWVPLADAGIVPEAVVAAEDARFWTHPGVDLEAVREALDEAGAKGDPGALRGGSTITQQLAKNLFLDGRRTLRRKLRELLLALELDRALGKERVLELYLNVVELGPGIRGIGPAARHYFEKRPDHLTVREAAFLAALLPAPRTLHNRAHLAGRPPRGRIDAIIENMRDGGAIDEATARAALREPLLFVPCDR